MTYSDYVCIFSSSNTQETNNTQNKEGLKYFTFCLEE